MSPRLTPSEYGSQDRFTIRWSRRRQNGLRWRREAVERVLAAEPVYPDDVAAVWDDERLVLVVDTPEVRAEIPVTPKEREALRCVYGYGLSQREAAARLGISRSALRDRLWTLNAKLEAAGVEVTNGLGRSNAELRKRLGEPEPDYISKMREATKADPRFVYPAPDPEWRNAAEQVRFENRRRAAELDERGRRE